MRFLALLTRLSSFLKIKHRNTYQSLKSTNDWLTGHHIVGSILYGRFKAKSKSCTFAGVRLECDLTAQSLGNLPAY